MPQLLRRNLVVSHLIGGRPFHPIRSASLPGLDDSANLLILISRFKPQPLALFSLRVRINTCYFDRSNLSLTSDLKCLFTPRHLQSGPQGVIPLHANERRICELPARTSIILPPSCPIQLRSSLTSYSSLSWDIGEELIISL